MEGMGRQLNRQDAQDRIRMIAMEHSVRHRTILARRAERLDDRYEALQDDLSQGQKDVFELAILQLQTDTCSQTIRGFALGALLSPAMFTTAASLEPEVASDMRRVEREALTLIREEHYVSLR